MERFYRKSKTDHNDESQRRRIMEGNVEALRFGGDHYY